MEYRTTQTPSNLATLFSAMGNIFVRANGSNLEYGFSTNLPAVHGTTTQSP